MYPFWVINEKYISMRDLSINTGSAISMVFMLVLLIRMCIREKTGFIKGLILALSPILIEVVIVFTAGEFVGTFVRGMMRPLSGNIIEDIKSIYGDPGSHFIGTVLSSCVLLPLLFRLIYRERSEKVLNIIAFFFPIQHFFNRLGCFFDGCCYGIPATGFLSVKYPSGEPPYSVFPSQLFESSLMLILFIILIILYTRKKHTFQISCFLFGAFILLSECFFDKMGVVTYMGLTAIQLASILLMVISSVFMVAAGKNKNRDSDSKRVSDRR